MVTLICNPGTWESQKDDQVWIQCGLYSKFQASLGYNMKPELTKGRGGHETKPTNRSNYIVEAQEKAKLAN